MRRKTLLWFTLLLAVAAGGGWTIRLEPDAPEWATRWGASAMVLSVAAIAGLAAYLAFLGLDAAARRRDATSVRGLGQLQVAATAVLTVVVAATLLGDVSGTLLSLGLVGFGLTLALQRPILALAGWATIFFGGMFREGDRIQVGELEGDVLTITLFTTKLWEIGEPGSRSPGRPTARVRTVSNAMFLERPVANATSDTAIVFDEFVVNVAYEADLEVAKETLRQVADEVLDPRRHESMAATYRRLTKGMRMEAYFPDRPRILMESHPSWLDLRLRYLVDAREAAHVRTRLQEAWQVASAAQGDALPPSYPRSQAMRIGGDGRPLDA